MPNFWQQAAVYAFGVFVALYAVKTILQIVMPLKSAPLRRTILLISYGFVALAILLLGIGAIVGR